MTDVLIKRGKRHEERRRPYDDGGRDVFSKAPAGKCVVSFLEIFVAVL
jgi:hypothetical protein